MSSNHISMRSNSASFSNHRIIDAILFSLFRKFANLKSFSNVDFEMCFANSFVIYFSFFSFIFRLFSLYILSSRPPYSFFYFLLSFSFFLVFYFLSISDLFFFAVSLSFSYNFLVFASSFCLVPPPVFLQLNFFLIFTFVLSILIFSFYPSACIFTLSFFSYFFFLFPSVAFFYSLFSTL